LVKRTYNTPTVDKLSFCYRDQVVAASGVQSYEAPVEEDYPMDIGSILNRVFTDSSKYIDIC